MAKISDWVEGARLRTLPAAIGPVLLGVGAAVHMGSFSAVRSVLALTTALALQIGVNYANDYSDGIRGADKDRLGPPRLTGGGLAEPKKVLMAALGCFAVAGVVGVALVIVSQLWWLLVAGALAIIAAWFYTGGKKPYGYSGVGLSELLVFVFFGLFATVGTAYVQTYSAPWWLWVSAGGIGLASVVLLMVNNIRDLEGDAKTGKRTVAVRLGNRASRLSIPVMLTVSAALGAVASCGSGTRVIWSTVVTLALLVAALPVVRPVVSGATGRNLLPALRGAGFYALAFGLIVGIVFALGASTPL